MTNPGGDAMRRTANGAEGSRSVSPSFAVVACTVKVDFAPLPGSTHSVSTND
ncbi:hypothetical protein SAMN05444359_12168 [Neolewinella agarilytica]|uniref:Uncharacterized protein n=1 Tax=Neolewinella agarilytica TaxID=478744 RepID=A0A1H9KQ94_9BACT|nr:hypothetical protein SAMN05444359_12168 [Neolewinella agarilytica]